MITLSHYTVQPLLAVRRVGTGTAAVSTDLGLSMTTADVTSQGVTFAGGISIPWSSVVEIADSDTTCFDVTQGKVSKIQLYSERYHRFYSLYPTERAPTMMLSGIPMHRIKNIDPYEDTLRKMKTVSPVVGEVLDVCTGMGYTSSQAARTASRVTTIELDPTVLEICRQNPWSQGLFDESKIQQLIGNGAEILPTLPDDCYSRIFHDPPTFKIAGELYSGEFYTELYRVLKRGGMLYHYIGDLDSTSGRVVAKGVVNRLQEAGFDAVCRRPEAFGITAQK